MMASKYLSKNVLTGFEKYKYSSVDTSPLSNYVMHPFWNWLVQFYPLWIAPNLLTCMGFSLIILNTILFAIFDPEYYASDDSRPEHTAIPNLMFLIAALSFFLAHQLDGTDGKQARRTGSSTPLGELMDHGLDSWASVLMPVCLYSLFGRGDSDLPPERLYIVMVAVTFMFFLSHWEKYNTGLLYLPWGYDVSQVGMTIIYLLAYFWGHQFCKANVPYVNISLAHVFEIAIHFSVWATGVPMCLWNVYRSYKDKTGKMFSAMESIRPLLPLLLEYFLFTAWFVFSPSRILDKHPRLFLLTFGTVYSNITCRCIVSGMSQTRAPAFNWMLFPMLPLLTVVLFWDVGVLESYLLYAYFLQTLVAHLHYGAGVARRMMSVSVEVVAADVKKKHQASRKTSEIKTTAAVKKSDHPSYADMIKQALMALKERGGSSRQAILKYMMANFKLVADENAVNTRLKAALRNGVKSELLKQSTDSAASGILRLGVDAVKKDKKAAVVQQEEDLVVAKSQKKKKAGKSVTVEAVKKNIKKTVRKTASATTAEVVSTKRNKKKTPVTKVEEKKQKPVKPKRAKVSPAKKKAVPLAAAKKPSTKTRGNKK